jgi:diguanylate cyclase (GGDEF)-like protein/PAS domain S-box-containing protein
MNEQTQNTRIIEMLRSRQEQICNWGLVSSSIFILPALIASISRSQNEPGHMLTNVHIILAVTVWLVTLFRQKLPYNFRAPFIIILTIMFGFAGLVYYGLLAGSLPLLVVIPALAAILYGVRIGLSIALSILLLICIFSFFVVNGWFNIIVDPSIYAKSLYSWILFALGYTIAAAALFTSIMLIIRHLKEALNNALENSYGLEKQVQITSENLLFKEVQLQEREKSLLEAQRAAKIGSWHLDVKSNQVVWSKELYRIYDLDPEDAPPPYTEHAKLFTFESWQRLNTALSATSTKGIPYKLELETLRRDGSKGWMWVSGKAQKNSAGTIVSVKGIAQDISELKYTEALLRDSEERYALAMKGANDGLWDWDVTNNKIHYSPRWKSMLGYNENELKDEVSLCERLVHPDDASSYLLRIQQFLQCKTSNYEAEFRMKHKQGHYVHILSRAFAVEDNQGEITRMVGTHVDITVQKEIQAELCYQASHDNLTGLVNRSEFEKQTQALIKDAHMGRYQHALCYIDLDQFKVVNDSCGHAAGDEMLRQVSKMLKNVVRNNDLVARLGGDEFGVLIKDCSLDDAQQVTKAIQKSLQDYQFTFEGKGFWVGLSIGLVAITANTHSLVELFKHADAACYMAKDKGRNRIHVHHENDSDIAQRHGEILWVNKIQHALDNGRFVLFAQLIEPLDGSTTMHCELLVRMLNNDNCIIAPGAFLPAAERYNLINKLDSWVVENAIGLLIQHPSFLDQVNFVSINLSGQSITNESFLDFTKNQLQKLNKHSAKICFEITETAAIANLTVANKFIDELRMYGCSFALDDFGSGLSSFAYLKNLPVDYLKIDGMFIKDIVDDPIDLAMVKSIHHIGKVMGMKTIAEFVENDSVKQILIEIGVDYAQGYGISKPQALTDLIRQIES